MDRTHEKQIGRGIRLYHRFISIERALRVAPLVREAVERIKQSLGSELEFDIFLVLDGSEVRFELEPV